MIRIDGPFRRAEKAGILIVELFEKDISSGDDVLAEMVSETRKEIFDASEPILYVLSGPEPAKTTPMQYGGYFLEKDRELLEFARELHAKDAKDRNDGEVWLFVDAGPGAYLDFVSDLPAEVFGWDAVKTGFPLAEMRKLRSGKLCTNEDGADLPFDSMSELREPEKRRQAALQNEGAKVG